MSSVNPRRATTGSGKREAETLVEDAALPRYELTGWRQEYGLVAGITAAGGDRDFTLSAETRWRELPKKVSPGFDGAVVGTQVHQSRLKIHEDLGRPWSVFDGVDGHLSSRAGTLLAVTVADCVPVYLAHPASGTIALLHAGWRGIAAGIVEAGIERLRQLAGAPARELIIHCGVSICGGCYQVGPEVVQAVLGKQEPKRLIDLRAVVGTRAMAVGLERASMSTWCTAHDGPRFHSHRASGGTAGRMAAYFGRPR